MDEFDVLVEEVGAYFSRLVHKSVGRWIPLLRRVKLGIRPQGEGVGWVLQWIESKPNSFAGR